jgi:hypothetical protein
MMIFLINHNEKDGQCTKDGINRCLSILIRNALYLAIIVFRNMGFFINAAYKETK